MLFYLTVPLKPREKISVVKVNWKRPIRMGKKKGDMNWNDVPTTARGIM